MGPVAETDCSVGEEGDLGHQGLFISSVLMKIPVTLSRDLVPREPRKGALPVRAWAPRGAACLTEGLTLTGDSPSNNFHPCGPHFTHQPLPKQ